MPTCSIFWKLRSTSQPDSWLSQHLLLLPSLSLNPWMFLAGDPAHRPSIATIHQALMPERPGLNPTPPPFPRALHYCFFVCQLERWERLLFRVVVGLALQSSGWLVSAIKGTKDKVNRKRRQERKRKRRHEEQWWRRPLEEVSEWSAADPEAKEVQCCCTPSSVSWRYYSSLEMHSQRHWRDPKYDGKSNPLAAPEAVLLKEISIITTSCDTQKVNLAPSGKPIYTEIRSLDSLKLSMYTQD